jgi:DNA end-binding protein Ku
VGLYSAEKRVDLHFRMLDSRDNKPIRYERVNAETGEEVPWNKIVKAFEYEKGNYVVLEEEDMEGIAPQGKEAIDIECFVLGATLNPMYYEKPYYLVPGKKAEKDMCCCAKPCAAAAASGSATSSSVRAGI